MAGISTHVLNITTGRPLPGMQIELYDMTSSPPKLLMDVRTNADGRTDKPMLSPQDTKVGTYELRFHVNDFFKAADALSEVATVQFSIFDPAQHYHVPMLCAPWYFSTYRGS